MQSHQVREEVMVESEALTGGMENSNGGWRTVMWDPEGLCRRAGWAIRLLPLAYEIGPFVNTQKV